jgi:hypothetical protein
MSGVAFTRCSHLSLFQDGADKGRFCLGVAISVCAEAAGQSLLEQMILLADARGEHAGNLGIAAPCAIALHPSRRSADDECAEIKADVLVCE